MRAAMDVPVRLSEVSAPRQVLLRVFQSIGYGQILNLLVRDREPIFDPPPTVLRDIKLGGDGGERPELELSDFALRAEVRRLLQCLDEVGTGRVQRIDIVAGIPRRILIESPLAEIRR